MDTGDFAFVLLLNSGYTTGTDRIHHVLFFDYFMIEFVADPPDAENITGILGFDFQLFSQVADVDHHRPGIPAKALCLPGQLKNLLCAEYPFGIFNKEHEYLKFFGGQADFFSPEFNSSILINREKKSRKPREIAVFYLRSLQDDGIIY